MANAVASIQECLNDSKDSELWVFRKPSLDDGLRRVEAALPEIEKSVSAFNAGHPFGPNTEKGRKPATQVSSSRRSADDQMIADVDAELAAEAKKRAVKKKAKPAKKRAAKKKGSG